MIMICFVYQVYIYNNDIIVNSELATNILLGMKILVEKV
jgi:hypothetical protein